MSPNLLTRQIKQNIIVSLAELHSSSHPSSSVHPQSPNGPGSDDGGSRSSTGPSNACQKALIKQEMCHPSDMVHGLSPPVAVSAATRSLMSDPFSIPTSAESSHSHPGSYTSPSSNSIPGLSSAHHHHRAHQQHPSPPPYQPPQHQHHMHQHQQQQQLQNTSATHNFHPGANPYAYYGSHHSHHHHAGVGGTQSSLTPNPRFPPDYLNINHHHHHHHHPGHGHCHPVSPLDAIFSASSTTTAAATGSLNHSAHHSGVFPLTATSTIQEIEFHHHQHLSSNNNKAGYVSGSSKSIRTYGSTQGNNGIPGSATKYPYSSGGVLLTIGAQSSSTGNNTSDPCSTSQQHSSR